jgi:uncharacterized protein
MHDVARTDPADPREWLRRARSNAQLARCRMAGVDLADLWFQAQQAAEKAIKAVLIARGARIPCIHDVGVLLRAVRSSGEAVPAAIAEAEALTEHATEARYPGSELISAAEYERVLHLMRAVLGWAERVLGTRGEIREPKTVPGYAAVTGATEDREPDPKLLRTIVDRIVEVASPERVILFGSAARRAMQRDSDIDLLIVKAGDYHARELKIAIRRSLRGLPYALDLVVATPEALERYRTSPALLFRPALEEGRVVYEATRIRARTRGSEA